MLRQIKLSGDLADRPKRIGVFIHPSQAPSRLSHEPKMKAQQT
jgi:hypothetical protein